MARKQNDSAPVTTSSPSAAPTPAPPSPTAESIVADWRAKGKVKAQTLTNFPGRVRSLRKLNTLQGLAETDKEELFARGTTQAHLGALGLVRDEGRTLVPKPQQEKKAEEKLPATPPDLLSRAEQRVMGTRSVAASRLGEANPLTDALGFKTPVAKTARALSDSLSEQRLIILQTDAAGNDLPNADANRARLNDAGFDAAYVDQMIAPLLIELAPFVGLTPDVEGQSVMEWECMAMVAAEYFYLQAELALQSTARVAKYHAAQPQMKAGRFKKKPKTKGKGKKTAAEDESTTAEDEAKTPKDDSTPAQPEGGSATPKTSEKKP